MSKLSRRQVNREITQPQFKENLHLIFLEQDDLPHADTLFRLLSKIDVDQIEESLIGLLKQLIEKKMFKRFLINNCYPIAIDGTQKNIHLYSLALPSIALLSFESRIMLYEKRHRQEYLHALSRFLTYDQAHLDKFFVIQVQHKQ